MFFIINYLDHEVCCLINFFTMNHLMFHNKLNFNHELTVFDIYLTKNILKRK